MTFEPLYMTIAKDIIYSIDNGIYKEGNKLPSERLLSNRYHVSRFTIRSAISYLEEMGYVYSLHGNGTFVKPQVIQIKLENLYDFSSVFKEQKVSFSQSILSSCLSSPSLILKSQMKLKEYENLHEIVVMFCVNDTPTLIQTHYISHTYCPRIDLSDVGNQCIEKYCLDRFSIRVERVEEVLASTIPERSIQELLNLNQTNQFIMTTRMIFCEDLPIIMTKTIMRGDKFSFVKTY